jgi:hypothetical protein
MTRIMATVLPVFTFVSGIPFMQDHTSPVFATNCLSGPWLTCSSPSRQWHTMSFGMAGFSDFVPG